MSITQQPPLAQVGKLISLIPVGLKEAALDSPTFRATIVHYADQIELIEKWLDGYAKSVGKLTSEVSTLEGIVNSFTSLASIPPNLSEAVLDPDYTLLAMKRYSEGTKEFWSTTIATLKHLDTLVLDPIRAFMQGELKGFKDTRRTLDSLQKSYDQIQARYASQARTKEPSALREDAFQLHEVRKSYLKVSMDFCALAPLVRNSLDKLLVRVFFDQWREMKVSREATAATFAKWSQEMERVRGWTREMEGSEKTFRRELHAARREIEETAEAAARPSRELEDYAISTVPYVGSGAMSTLSLKSPGKSNLKRPEKQGWLNLRTYTGKPTRTLWVRRWGFVKNGIFGWLIQGFRSGGVEESERIGVLLCNVRPAFQEERRFCFEVKTKNNAMMLQAETQAELTEWISVFEAAKQKALDNPSRSDLDGKSSSIDPAFSISPPPVPEFAANLSDSLSPQGADEPQNSSFDRISSLPIPGTGDATRSSIDVSNQRRSTTLDKESEGSRDHTSRIIQKLDLHRKSNAASTLTGGRHDSNSPATPSPAGGIASLIAASHHIMPVGPGMPMSNAETEPPKGKVLLGLNMRDMPYTTLAPSSLANPPAPTGLSKAAVSVSGERVIGVGRPDTTGGMPSGIMANVWGSSNWGYINRLERGELRPVPESRASDSPFPSPKLLPAGSSPKMSGLGLSIDESNRTDFIGALDEGSAVRRSQTPSPSRHRQTISLDGDAAKVQRSIVTVPQEFPNYYPIQLKAQDAQFRLLFPNVLRDDRVVLVFRATWNPNDQQEFPGRAYVTTSDIYFYSNHLGLVLTSGLTLSSISEVTAAPGRDCDFLFLHMEHREDDSPNRVTIKTFLEPLKLLQRRLNYLIRNSSASEPDDLELVVKTLIKMESEEPQRSPSLESWEDVSLNTPADESTPAGRSIQTRKVSKDLKAPIHVDRDLIGGSKPKDVAKFKLPSRPIEYVPQGNLPIAVEKHFNISPKALFHVLFGDKSAVWQLLHHERQAREISQGPWLQMDKGHMARNFEYQIESKGLFWGVRQTMVSDYQIVDVLNDHLCYVVTDKRTPWHLPFRDRFMLVTKIVITHFAKSKSKLSIYTKVEWLKNPPIMKGAIERQAVSDINQDALDLADLILDQVRKLGAHSRTKKAIHIFGLVGQENQVSHFAGSNSPVISSNRRSLRSRSLAHLLLETTGSFLESAISSVMLWVFSFLRLIWKTCSAHSILLVLLVLSAVFNGFYWRRDTYDWWQERNAAKFMNRVGVGPNVIMSKAVYLRDVDEVMVNSTSLPVEESSSCYTIFRNHNLLYDIDAPTTKVPSITAQRLQRTRQRLGSYRHDLLVALRVINRIETEVVEAAWEKWIEDETRRCRHIGSIIEAQKNKTEPDDDQGRGLKAKLQQALAKGAQPKGGSTNQEPVLRGDMYDWYLDYCGSCQREREVRRDGSRGALG